jgi:hypothetical protein
MNQYQELWWEQSQSDHSILVLLRRNGSHACQQLHYLTDNAVRHDFALWRQLTGTAMGRHFVKVVGLAVDRFPTYG